MISGITLAVWSKKLSSLLKVIIVSILVLTLLACASTANVPIESRTQPPSKKITTHIVEKGDTLYSIAWRYEQNYKKLASLNGIRAPYTIYIGQKIKLSGTAGERAATSVTASAASVSTASVQTRPTAPDTTRAVPASRPPTTVASSPSVKSPASASNRRTPSATGSPAIPGLPSSVQGWNWPLKGKIVKTFGSNDLTKGITIDSSANKDVNAAAEGVVVYSGSGVRGYGNFLILKHSDAYLSAYAYNAKLLASEGDQVRKGQKIAVAGNDLQGKPRLYFEIRKNGKPVDPVRYLPKR